VGRSGSGQVGSARRPPGLAGLASAHPRYARVAHLTSNRGDFDPVRDAMVVRGSVVLENAERTRRMETEDLHYLPARDSVWSPVRSVYYRSGLEVRADSFVS